MWRIVWMTVENDNSLGELSVAWRWVIGTICVPLHTNIVGTSGVVHCTYHLNLSHFSPPSLDIAVWSISTTTCVRAASFLGAPPRATSSTTPWWNTVHRWGSRTHRHRHAHFQAVRPISVLIIQFDESIDIPTDFFSSSLNTRWCFIKKIYILNTWSSHQNHKNHQPQSPLRIFYRFFGLFFFILIFFKRSWLIDETMSN